jgi:hypothetical protein
VGPRHDVETLVVMQPVRVDTDSVDEEGRLVFADGLLVAILVQLQDSDHERAGQWFLEVGLGSLQGVAAPTFASLPEATRWIRRRITGPAPQDG